MDDEGVVKEIRDRSLRTEGYKFVCKSCGKVPQDIGWCDECGYNRDYEMIQDGTRH